jgi:hypothetical protein
MACAERDVSMSAEAPKGVTTSVIPADPQKADGLADELGQLATAAEWKRAALVYARVKVQDSQGRPTTKKVTDDLLTPAEYALRGIHGLRSKTTIRPTGGLGITRSPKAWHSR